MGKHEARLKKLEAKSKPPRRIVVRYADQTDPAELEALRKDESITLLIVEYASKKTEPNI